MKNIRGKYIPVLTNNYLPQDLVWISFWGEVRPPVTYPLPVLSISPSQSDNFMIPLYKHLFPSLKASRNLLLVYQYGSTKYGGLGLPKIFIEQTISRLSILMIHSAADTLPGQHIRHTMGVGNHFFQLPYLKFGSYTN